MYGHGKPKRWKVDLKGRGQNQDAAGLSASPVDDCNGWQAINEWLLSLSLRDFTLLAETIQDWNGAEDVDLEGYDINLEPLTPDEQSLLKGRYGQAAMATIYATSDTTPETWTGSLFILSKVASLFGAHPPSADQMLSDINQLPSDVSSVNAFANVHRGLLFYNELLQPSNPFTSPTPDSISFLNAVLISVHILRGFGDTVTAREVAELCLFAGKDEQLYKFHALLESINHGHANVRNWNLARGQLLWLRAWTDIKSQSQTRGVFRHIPLVDFERGLLRAILTAKGEYKLVHLLCAV
jgi:hypothetical protein